MPGSAADVSYALDQGGCDIAMSLLAETAEAGHCILFSQVSCVCLHVCLCVCVRAYVFVERACIRMQSLCVHVCVRVLYVCVRVCLCANVWAWRAPRPTDRLVLSEL